jgi:hypothetical protein
MQDFYEWFLGRELYSTGKWLFGIPTSPPETSETNDETILTEIAHSFDLLRGSILSIQAICDRIKLLKKANEDKYNFRHHAYQKLIALAKESKRLGNIFEARSAMGQAMQIESLLPQFLERVELVQKMAIDIEDFQLQQLAALNLLESDLEMSKISRGVASDASDLNYSSTLMRLKDKIDSIRDEIKSRYDDINFQIQLADSSHCVLGRTFTLEEIDNRLCDLDDLRLL